MSLSRTLVKRAPQIPTKDFRSPPCPITRSKLAKNIARTVERFIKVRFLHNPPIVTRSPTHSVCRRSPGLRWTLTRIPGGRSAPVTSRSMIWFWLDFNTCRKAHGSAIFDSTDLSNQHPRPVISQPPLPSLFHSRFFFPRHSLFARYPRLRIPIFMGCFLKGRVVGCHGVPHCPKFPFSSPLSDPSGR